MTALATLHYIYDPLCGWCYGAKPLIQAAQAVLPVVAYGGGMMTGNNRQPVSAQLRDYVMPHDQRIAEFTGQPFGSAYFDGLLRDTSAVFDSAPPITAVLVADQLAGRGLEFLAELQSAHYVEGRRISDPEVLLALAAELGFDMGAFGAAFEHSSGPVTQAHIKDSRSFLTSVGGQGFPTLVLETMGQFQLIDLGPYLGQPRAFAQWLAQAVQPVGLVAGTAAPFCGLEGCAP